jgi:hypothetical protein
MVPPGIPMIGLPHLGSIYGGTQSDLKFAQAYSIIASDEGRGSWDRVYGAAGLCAVAVDLPLSAAADTALLPLTIPGHFFWGLIHIDDSRLDGVPWWKTIWQIDLSPSGLLPIPEHFPTEPSPSADGL